MPKGLGEVLSAAATKTRKENRKKKTKIQADCQKRQQEGGGETEGIQLKVNMTEIQILYAI